MLFLYVRKLSHKIWSWNHFFQACLHDLELENGIAVLNKGSAIGIGFGTLGSKLL
ncbi:hypothetical protein RchiOBHm_Chr5g0079771 [Rosa chinensis]|uniref:Uncharacterized protein n=1 Tax=Rosa chinensis TaxID=74649 RepID=A0A2P6QMK9_ROSCH|nr:hypothetical protein RchiOBHm_Chr5g0079771 [Rosa chinensis]